MQLAIQDKKIAVLGIQGSGKTEWVKNIAKNFKTIVYTPHLSEWKKTKVHLAQYNSFLGDLERFIAGIKNSKYNVIVIDEFDLVCSKGYILKYHMNDLTINHRHYKKALILVSRRPQDIPPKIFETCHYIVAFTLEGFNAIKRLNEIRTGFGDMVKSIPFGSYQYALKEVGKEPVVCDAVEL